MKRTSSSTSTIASNSLKSGYTDEQLKVINHLGGHAKVSAVAGSGKTTALIGRMLKLMGDGVPAKRIIGLMFNRSARQHFYAKLKQETQGGPTPRIQTFHGFALALTESLVDKGALKKCVIEGSNQRYARSLTLALKEALGAYPSTTEIDQFATFEQHVKSDIISAEEKLKQLNTEQNRLGQRCFAEHLPAAFTLFEQRRNSNQIRFYADLIYDTAKALQRDPLLSKWVTNRFEHILIDECQDINQIQQYIVKTVAGTRASVMVVGDVDQAIYTWNGARPDFLISGFEAAYSKVTRYKLSRSFRFGHVLSLAANNCITHNKIRDDIYCLSAPTTPNTRVKVIQHEANESPLCGIVRYWRGSGNRLKDCLVLVRLNASTVPIEFMLLGYDIPYRVHGARTVFARKEVQALLGYLRLINGSLYQRSDSHELIQAMLSFPRLQLSRGALDQLTANLAAGNPALEAINSILGQMSSPRQKAFLEYYAGGWDAIGDISNSTSVVDALGSIMEILNLKSNILKSSSETMGSNDQQCLLDGMLSFAEQWPNSSINAFLDFCATQATFDPDESDEDRPYRDSVQIATVHKVKGLESPLVIVADLEEGLFPLDTHSGDPGLLDDERRLFYVAITRAIKQLYCLCPIDPALDNAKISINPGQFIASRFVHEMQLKACQAIGNQLHKGEAPNTAGAGQLFTRYITKAEHDIQSRATASESDDTVIFLESKNRGEICTKRPPFRRHKKLEDGADVTGGHKSGLIWKDMPVRHGSFGNGTITRIRHSRELGEHIDVEFDSGKRLSVPSAHLHLTYRKAESSNNSIF